MKNLTHLPNLQWRVEEKVEEETKIGKGKLKEKTEKIENILVLKEENQIKKKCIELK